MARELRLGTRGSRLALAQARLVADALETHDEGIRVHVETILTEGDDGPPTTPPPRRGAKALFTSRIEASLLEGGIDVAVHSMKDLPADGVEGLVIGAVPRREEPRDALVSSNGSDLSTMPDGARIGTGSLRRAAQLRAARPDVVVEPVRGNVDTRVQKMREDGLHGLVLAAAGLNRLGRGDLIAQLLPTDLMLPAPAQGALAVQARADDSETLARLQFLDDAPSRAAVEAERAVARALGGDCNVPLGAFARPSAEGLRLEACVARPDGGRLIRKSAQGPVGRPDHVGSLLARKLLDEGADEILREAKAP